MTRTIRVPLCTICGDKSDAMHFGAPACRACAAFFRRRVVGRKSISISNCKGNCRIENKTLRNLCGSCRYEKCLKVGMKTSAVLAKPAMMWRPEPGSQSLLEQMKMAYGRLENARRESFRKQDRIPSAANYKDFNKTLLIDLDLIRQHFLEFFISKTQAIDENQQKLLRDYFVPIYSIFDGAFRSQDSSLILMLNMDFVDLKELSCFYENPDEENDEIALQVTRLVEQYWWFANRVLLKHVKEVKLDVQEFLLASALLFWDFGIPGQSDECIQVCNKMRSKVITELIGYEKSKSSSINYPLRVAEIMIVLQSVHKVWDTVIESRSLTMVYNLCGRECPLCL